MHQRKTLLALLAVAAPLSSAWADQLQGRVVDANGAGIPGINIDAIDQVTGDNVNLANDGTDSQGFFDVTIPTGLYQIQFFPPPPPTTKFLPLAVDDVLVVGTANMGNVTLATGVALTGTVQTQSGQAVPNVSIEVLVGGQPILLTRPGTDSAGQFSLAVPPGPLELRLDATGIANPLLASRALDLAPTVDTNLGIVVLPPGFLVTATVKRTNGTPVQGVDIDMIDAVTKEKAFTPGDNTNTAGFVDVTVAAGTYVAEFCPKFSDRLVALTTAPVVVNATTNLGTITLQPGVVLSGHVDSATENGVANVDVDLTDSATMAEITLCMDNTNANGDYAVVVPTGTFDIDFDPPVGSGYQQLIVPGFTISADSTLDVTLTAGGGGSSTVYCDATQNPNNAANIGISTLNANASSITVSMTGGAPNQFVYLLVGNGSNTVHQPPGAKGDLCIVGGSCLGRYDKDVGKTSATGDFGLDIKNVISNPCQGGVVIAPGATWNFQFWHRQPMGTPATFSAALSVTFQ